MQEPTGKDMDQKSPEAFRTISEVAEWLGVPTHVLRFWESRFSQVKPVKRAGGRRYYRPADMELLGGIRKLLHEDGMTIRGVQKLLREQGVKYVSGMSPPLDLAADAQDVTPSNVVELSERRGDEAETIEDAEEVEAWEPEAEPSQEAEPEWAVPEDPAPDDADDRTSPERVVFHAHDAEPEMFEGETTPGADFNAPTPDPDPVPAAAPTPAPAPDRLDPADMTEAPVPDAPEPVAAAPAPPAPEARPEPPAPAPPPAPLVMPDIGPDPEDAAYHSDRAPIAALLRRARTAEVDLPAATLQALADRLGALAGRIGAETGPRR